MKRIISVLLTAALLTAALSLCAASASAEEKTASQSEEGNEAKIRFKPALEFFGDVDEQNLELIRRVKIYERLASEAIRTKSRTKAVEALTLHPLVASYSLATKLVDAYLAHNKAYTEGWQ